AVGLRGAGGPVLILDAASAAAIEQRAAQIEKELQTYEGVLRDRARVPSIWPVEGHLSDGFGMRGNPFGDASPEFHTGQDISAAWGAPVVATGNGVVTFAGTQNGYGQVVIIDHGDGITTRYGHLSRIEVVIGQSLARGEALGHVGSTGRSTGPHLHYEVRLNEAAVSPRRYLPERAGAENAE
ncbi:MAG: M23 family metallopeptidase, partial [Pyrinomonadaceae bacterium]